VAEISTFHKNAVYSQTREQAALRAHYTHHETAAVAQVAAALKKPQ